MGECSTSRCGVAELLAFGRVWNWQNMQAFDIAMFAVYEVYDQSKKVRFPSTTLLRFCGHLSSTTGEQSLSISTICAHQLVSLANKQCPLSIATATAINENFKTFSRHRQLWYVSYFLQNVTTKRTVCNQCDKSRLNHTMSQLLNFWPSNNAPCPSSQPWCCPHSKSKWRVSALQGDLMWWISAPQLDLVRQLVKISLTPHHVQSCTTDCHHLIIAQLISKKDHKNLPLEYCREIYCILHFSKFGPIKH